MWGAIRAVADGDGNSPSLRHAVAACAQALSAAGAGFAMARDGGVLEPLLATDPAAAELDELQFTLGEGPSDDAINTGRPALEPDLASHDAGGRWPVFASAGVDRGVHGAFAFPVGLGAAKVGVLSVYRKQAGPLRSDEIQDGLVFADAVLVLALDHRHGISADLNEVIEAAFTARHAEVHQAAGLVAAQHGISVTDALARLRAHAYSHSLSLRSVATDIMAGRTRLEFDRSTAGPAAPSDPKEMGSQHAEMEQEEDG